MYVATVSDNDFQPQYYRLQPTKTLSSRLFLRNLKATHTDTT